MTRRPYQGGDADGGSRRDRSRSNENRARVSVKTRVGPLQRFKAYWLNHLQALFHSLGRLVQSPLSALMTVAVIAIALALPTGLHVVLKNLQGVGSNLEDAAQISLFLTRDTSEARVEALANELSRMAEVASIQTIRPAEALEEFRRLSGFGEAIDALDANPLPTVLVIRPRVEFSTPGLLQTLVGRLRGYQEVELAQLDLEWVKRLQAMMEIGRRGVLVLAALLALAVLLIVGNTIRLAIQSQRDEIEVQKLIGATDAFIRRPFLYSGVWHGLFGAVMAWILVALALALLDGPVQRLAALYHSSFALGGLSVVAVLALVLFGALLGLLGAWLAVGRHLREIEPS